MYSGPALSTTRITRTLLACASLLLAVAGTAHAFDEAKRPVPRDSTLDAWIEDLRSDDWVERESAHSQLQLAVAHARPKLLDALNGSTDPQQRRRLYALLYDGPTDTSARPLVQRRMPRTAASLRPQADPNAARLVFTRTPSECRRLASFASILTVNNGKLHAQIVPRNLGHQSIAVLEITVSAPDGTGGIRREVLRWDRTSLTLALPPRPGLAKDREAMIEVNLGATGATSAADCRVEITAVALAGD